MGDRSIDTLLARVVDEHAPWLSALEGEILARLRETVPEFFADPDVAYDMGAAVAANVRRFGQLLRDADRHGAAPALPHEAGDLLQSTIQHGIPLVSLLEAYRTAQSIAAAWWQERIEGAAPPRQVAPATRRFGAVLVAYIDAAAAQVRASYELERRALESSPEGRRAHLIRKVLAGELLDTDAAARTLGHPLAGAHVGLVLWRADPEVPEAALAAALASLAADRPVLRMAARHRVYAWVSAAGTLDPAPLHAARLPAGVRAAMSGVHRGIAGFVQAHEDAVRTAAAVRDEDATDGRVAVFERLELMTLLTQDPDATRRFVHRVLGPLAAATTAAARQRETLQAYFEAGSSATRAARRLGVHRNTVLYRLAGVDLETVDRLELEVALRLAQYGGKSAYQSPSARNADQKDRLASSSSRQRSMSGV